MDIGRYDIIGYNESIILQDLKTKGSRRGETQKKRSRNDCATQLINNEDKYNPWKEIIIILKLSAQ